VISLVMVAMVGAVGHAQNDLNSTVHQVGYSLGIYRGFKETDYIIASQFEANGTMQVNGQTMKVPRYKLQVRWDTPGMRIDYDVEQGGKTQRRVEVVSGKYAWDEDKPGAGLTPTSGKATPTPAAYTERLIQMWLTPHGIAKAAAAAGAKAKLDQAGGKPVLTFPLPAPAQATTMTVELDPANARPVKATVQSASGPIEATFSDYKDFDNSDVYYPSRIVHRRGGQVVLDLTVTAGEGYNPYVIVPVPKSVSAGQPGRVGE
jgi:hypothetical protein